MEYNNETGYWENRALSIATDGILLIEAEEGSVEERIDAGDLDVRIVSGSYVLGKSYDVNAKVLFQDISWVADVKYKLWDSELNLVAQGAMKQKDDVYTAEVDLNKSEQLILEVTAQNSSLTGGRFKLIRPTNVTTFDYTVEPGKWIVTATEPGSETMVFKIDASSDISGLLVEKGGGLSNFITLDTTMMESDLVAGDSTEFRATLDWSSLSEGEYSGELFVGSDQLSAVIPVHLYHFAIAGEWLEVDKKVLKVEVPKGRSTEKLIRLTNLASLPTTGIKLSASGELTDIVSFAREPYYVNGSESKDARLLFDAATLTEGSYSGTITITSSLGDVEILANMEVTPDIDEMLDTIENEWQVALNNLTAGGAELSEEAAILSELVSGNITQARVELAAENYAEALEYYNDAEKSLNELKKIEPPFGLDLLIILIVVVIIGAGAYVGWRFLKKKKKKKKKEVELPKAEEQYRTEYY